VKIIAVGKTKRTREMSLFIRILSLQEHIRHLGILLVFSAVNSTSGGFKKSQNTTSAKVALAEENLEIGLRGW
jgi:hypothetical protein